MIQKIQAFVVLCVLAMASSASAQVCDENNPRNPENDCDRDGQTVGAGDCRDDDNTVGLNAPERCDGKDNDCDSVIDEGFDDDNDGFKECIDSCVASCDCDDTNAAIHPGATETCDVGGDANENITRSCYDGPAGTNNVGVCRGGATRARAPKASTTSAAPTPSCSSAPSPAKARPSTSATPTSAASTASDRRRLRQNEESG